VTEVSDFLLGSSVAQYFEDYQSQRLDPMRLNLVLVVGSDWKGDRPVLDLSDSPQTQHQNAALEIL
jgi:hypothetical protein